MRYIGEPLEPLGVRNRSRFDAPDTGQARGRAIASGARAFAAIDFLANSKLDGDVDAFVDLGKALLNALKAPCDAIDRLASRFRSLRMAAVSVRRSVRRSVTVTIVRTPSLMLRNRVVAARDPSSGCSVLAICW
jgi:hypothetical protein